MLATEGRYEPAPLSEYRLVVPDRLPAQWNGEPYGDCAGLAHRFAGASQGFALAQETRHVCLHPTPAPVRNGVWVLRDLFGRR